QIVGGDEVVDGDDVECFPEPTLLHEGAEDQPADAAEAVDAHFHCSHLSNSLTSGRPAGFHGRAGSSSIALAYGHERKGSRAGASEGYSPQAGTPPAAHLHGEINHEQHHPRG